MVNPIFDRHVWESVPFHFWSVVFFIFGSIVGSFLNVCIYRMPIGESIVSPPSHCPHCKYSIPWYLNIPLFTWLYLGGKCRNCRAPISSRYFLVELLTGIAFWACWQKCGLISPLMALCYCVLIAGLITATFIDFEHFIIPDEITFGGIGVGFVLSILVPRLHGQTSMLNGALEGFLGILCGGGIIYLILRIGKLLIGRHNINLPPDSTITFSESALHLPDSEIPYEEIFYRPSDQIVFHASRLELVDRCYQDVVVKLSPTKLQIGDESVPPESVMHMEALCSGVVLPREVMGLGDVKFMAAIGAFLGWRATIFSLVVSSAIGALVGMSLVVTGRRQLSSQLPYGPYIALGAVLWMFAGPEMVALYLRLISRLVGGASV